MVQWVRPVERSEDIIDYRIKRSPRGAIPLSAAAVLAKQKLDRQRQIDEMKAEAKRRADYMRWLRAPRG